MNFAVAFLSVIPARESASDFVSRPDALIVLGVARDLIVARRIHVVYRYALPAFVVGQIFVVQIWLHQPQWWVNFTNTIILG